MIIPTRKSIRLKRGHTYKEYVLKRNEDKASYDQLCKALKISLEEAREIYDKVFNLPLEKIGTMKEFPVTEPSEYGYWNGMST